MPAGKVPVPRLAWGGRGLQMRKQVLSKASLRTDWWHAEEEEEEEGEEEEKEEEKEEEEEEEEEGRRKQISGYLSSGLSTDSYVPVTRRNHFLNTNLYVGFILICHIYFSL